MKLQQMFNSEDSRVLGAVMFVDMSNSTEMKEKQAEQTWLGTLAALFDTIRDEIDKAKTGTIVKYLGDGVMLVYDVKSITDAINNAISIQEILEENRKKRIFDCHCTIGIATGRMVKAQTAQGALDYFGSVVDRAARLCSAGSPNSILVDQDTIENSLMMGIISRIGEALDRTGAEYKGDKQQITLKGFSKLIDYYEILWARERFGIKSEALTNAVQARASQVLVQSDDNGQRQQKMEWIKGEVTCWNIEKHFGFIKGSDGIDYYVNINLTIGDHPLDKGRTVYFVPKDPLQSGTKPAASCVVILDEQLQGVVQYMDYSKHFGFITVRDRYQDFNKLFVHAGDHSEEFHNGDHVVFMVTENKKGVAAQNARVIPYDTQELEEASSNDKILGEER